MLDGMPGEPASDRKPGQTDDEQAANMSEYFKKAGTVNIGQKQAAYGQYQMNTMHNEVHDADMAIYFSIGMQNNHLL